MAYFDYNVIAFPQKNKPHVEQGPTFNDVVHQRSPVGRLPSSSSGGSRSGSTRASKKAAMPPPPPPPAPLEVAPASPPTSIELDDASPSDSDARYDGVYYTREPLNNKPASDFPTKTLDVDIDPVSYKPHGNRPSAL